MDPALSKSIRQVRLLVFDFDGVFTDNTVWVNQEGVESVRCWRSDGLGLQRLRQAGLPAMVLSTEENPVVSARCRKLKIECVQGSVDKRASLVELAKARGIDLDQIAYLGNDTNDLGCLQSVGFPMVVEDAYPGVIPLARYRTRAKGGFGAVREVCDLFADMIGKGDVAP
ncbi:MAG TPA: HAD hydrolase family protein [Fibrobacteria bacterium]|nr:HAD hydrolase family protein [Fibrobacteria bacterium]